jgi:hypothetical protein
MLTANILDRTIPFAQGNWANSSPREDAANVPESTWRWSNARQRATGANLPNPTVIGLKAEIAHLVADYPDGWDEPGSLGTTAEAGGAIMLALDRIPSGLVLPRTMLSRDGEIGLYWDLPNGAYADLTADRCAAVSFFSRDVDGHECFEEVHAQDLSTAWFWARIGVLAISRAAHAG